MTAEVIAIADVDAVWPRFAEDVVKCLRRTPNPDYSAGDYWTMCRSGMAFMIAAHDAGEFQAMTIWRFEGDRFVCMLMVGQNSRIWKADLIAKAIEVGRNGGATGLRAGGRLGLGRLIKSILPDARVTRQTYEVTI